MDNEIIARIILTNPPTGIDFALQKGKGSKYECVQIQRSEKAELQFEFPLHIKSNNENHIDFYGPFVQGPPNERFVYIDIGSYAGQKNTQWSRRLKIPLKGITIDKTDRMKNNQNRVLITYVPGTGKDGGPNCATVKPFEGWKWV